MILDGQRILANLKVRAAGRRRRQPGPLATLNDLATVSRSVGARVPQIADELLASSGELRTTLRGTRQALNAVGHRS